MLNNDIINQEKTGQLLEFPYPRIEETEKSRGVIKITINIKGDSTGVPSYSHQAVNEVNVNMLEATKNKLLPSKESIDVILAALKTEEKDEFLTELLHMAVKVVSTYKPEYIEAMRQLIIAWEYTAEIESDPAFAKKLEDIRKEVTKDQSPGVEWRELLRR